MKNNSTHLISNSFLLFTAFLLISSCYSLKGISIPSDVNTFYVEDFNTSARNAPSDINQVFSEALRQKVRNESRLQYSEIDPDIIFSGTIASFRVNSVAPTEGNTTALNRLEIKVKVVYENVKNEEDTWDSNFSFFNDFDSTQDLLSIQDELIDNIFVQLTEDVFNKAFTNW